MDITTNKLEENKVELTVTIPTEEIEKALKVAYAKAADNRIKGFRKGKAPRSVLDKVFGGPEYFLVEATDEVIKASYLLAIDDQGYVPLDAPDMSTIEPAIAGEDYTYTFTFTAAPELTLSSYEPVQIELPADEPTAEEIQSRVDTMLGYYVEYMEVEDRTSQLGDRLTLEITVTNDGQKVDALSGENVPFDLGIDQMPEDFEAHFIGLAPGDEVSFDFEMPFYDGAEDGEDQELHVDARCKALHLRVVPELTDEWVSEKLSYESAEHFRQLIADSLRDQIQSTMPALKERRVADALAQRLEGDPPELLVSETEQGIYSDIFMVLQNQGVTLDTYLASINQDIDSFRESVQTQALDNARQTMAFDAWARHYELEATEEDIRAEFEKAESLDVDAAIQEWIAVGRMTEIRQGIKRMKASQQLNEEAIVSLEAPKSAEDQDTVQKTSPAPDADESAAAAAEAEPADAAADPDTAEPADTAAIAESADAADPEATAEQPTE
ncbi:MAG: trigger factor [Coriobacteriia bacterium]|nr:trigger factor [Coriobacteriia bacterium]